MFDWLYTEKGDFDWKWVVTTLAVLGTAGANIYREISSRRERRTAIKVELNLGIVALLDNNPRWQLQVWVANHGRRDVTFNANSIAIQSTGWESRLVLFGPTAAPEFPTTLRPGTSFNVMADRNQLVAALQRAPVGIRPSVRAVITDALGSEYHSTWQFADLNSLQQQQFPG